MNGEKENDWMKHNRITEKIVVCYLYESISSWTLNKFACANPFDVYTQSVAYINDFVKLNIILQKANKDQK